jgi:peptidoglycan hydrolase-like protein with peptidoglycan-binding domain
VLTSNGVSADPSFQAAAFTAMPWTDESTTFSPAVGNGYFVTGTATATLPASPSQGNTISFILDATNILTITGNSGQVIRLGATVSASAGTCASNKRGDAITLVYRASDTTWLALNSVGTWTVT